MAASAVGAIFSLLIAAAAANRKTALRMPNVHPTVSASFPCSFLIIITKKMCFAITEGHVLLHVDEDKLAQSAISW